MTAILPVDIAVADHDPLWVVDHMNRIHRRLPGANVRDVETLLDALDDLTPGHPSVILCTQAAADEQSDVMARIRAERPEVTVLVAEGDDEAVLAAVEAAWVAGSAVTAPEGRAEGPSGSADDPVQDALVAGLGRGTLLVAVTSGKGGTGATTVAVNLAAGFAAVAGGEGERVVLVDAHGAWGDVLLMLGLPTDDLEVQRHPGTSGPLDAGAVGRRLVRHDPSGIDVLALGPDEPFGPTGVRTLLEALVALDGTATVVVVDAPLDLVVASGLASFASAALLVTSGDLTALKDTALAAAQLDRPATLAAVFNHPADRPVAPDAGDVAHLLGVQVVAQLPHDTHLGETAHERPPTAVPPERSGFTRRIRRLADELAGQLAPGRRPGG